MRNRMLLSLVGGLALLSLIGCAESLHQTQRVEAEAAVGSSVITSDVPYSASYYGYPGYWGAPFGYYSGIWGPWYGSPYYGYYGRPWGGWGGHRAAPYSGPRGFSRRR